ncbi:MAG: PepSY domain-containing protein [Bryobacteraceae bacterium]
MSRATSIHIKRWCILLHRWLGVGFCLLFALWFLSGVVLMYFDYPRIQPEQRFAHLAPIGGVALTPAEAFARSGLGSPPLAARLNMLGGRPVYRFHTPGRNQTAVYADDGASVSPVPESLARRMAAEFARLPASSATLVGPLEIEDQWTLNKTVRSLKPWLKFVFDDAAATEVYVSQRTGEVLQATTRSSRMGAYLGAVIHWVYFTPLRARTDLWRGVVIAVSAVGVVMCLAGIVVGLWLYSPSRRYRLRGMGSTAIPYVEMKRWHYVLGLGFGLFTFTWILSGLFSMNPLHWSPESVTPALTERIAGGEFRLDRFGLPRVPAGVREIEFVQFDGKPLVLASFEINDSVLIDAAGRAFPALPAGELERVIVSASGIGALRDAAWLTDYDAYYYDRQNRKPLPVLRLRFDDPNGTWLYADPRGGRIVAGFARLNRIERWLYHGLHSLDFPWLYRQRPLWDVLVIALCTGCFVLSLTAVRIAITRVRRAVTQASRADPRPAMTSHPTRAASAPAESPAAAIRAEPRAGS